MLFAEQNIKNAIDKGTQTKEEIDQIVDTLKILEVEMDGIYKKKAGEAFTHKLA